jgi:hypothetical protein
MDSLLTTPYAGETVLQVALVTGVLGGTAAALSGRAIASTWRPYWHALCYLALLGAAVRFIHFALLGGGLLSLQSYVADTVFLVAVGSLAFRVTRAAQLVRQYPWIYESTGPLSWRKRHQAAEKSP